MDEKIIEISFNIIGYAGEGKGLAFEAIKEAKNGNIEKAKELLKEAGNFNYTITNNTIIINTKF